MVQYQRISLLEREEISRKVASGTSLRKIAQLLHRAPSSISREIRQSGVVDLKYYRAIFAQWQSNKMRHKLRKNRKLANNIPLRKFVLQHLAKNWSPEQIAKRLILLCNLLILLAYFSVKKRLSPLCRKSPLKSI